jgi:hypothetical protein
VKIKSILTIEGAVFLVRMIWNWRYMSCADAHPVHIIRSLAMLAKPVRFIGRMNNYVHSSVNGECFNVSFSILRSIFNSARFSVVQHWSMVDYNVRSVTSTLSWTNNLVSYYTVHILVPEAGLQVETPSVLVAIFTARILALLMTSLRWLLCDQRKHCGRPVPRGVSA